MKIIDGKACDPRMWENKEDTQDVGQPRLGSD